MPWEPGTQALMPWEPVETRAADELELPRRRPALDEGRCLCCCRLS